MNPRSFHNGKVQLYAGDCMEVLRELPDNSIDAVCTDPPYHLTSIVKRFGSDSSKPPRAKSNMHDKVFVQPNAKQYVRLTKGFMGKVWDGGDIAFTRELWAEVLRVLKPGGHMVCFGGTRTYHRMACAIEDAGFEIRDQLAWTYGSGFPKSHNIGNGWGTALKPAWEPICLARKPLSESTVAANVLRWGTGAINVDGCRIETDWSDRSDSWKRSGHSAKPDADKIAAPPGNGINCHSLGRFPANLIHDGSPEVLAGFPENTSKGNWTGKQNGAAIWGGGRNGYKGDYHEPDSGSAARFFYTTKADADDRLGSKHPTVKPVDLMQWLVRLVCPKGGTVLDPFAGTGTTAAAAFIEGCRAVLIEREAEYLADIERRMELLLSGSDERARKLAKAEPYESLPLFGVA